MLSAIKSAIPQPIRRNWWEIRAHGVTPYVSRRLRNLTAQAYLAMGVRRVCPHVNGVRLWVDLQDPYVGRLIYTYRTYEPTSTAYLRKSLTSGLVFVDVGAHVGYFTTLAAGLVGKSGRVIAIEPEQYNY